MILADNLCMAQIDIGKEMAKFPNWQSNNVLPYGWAGELAYPNRTNFEDHYNTYVDMLNFVSTNVKNYHNNCQWTKIGDCVYFMFRKQKDLSWFIMRFGL